MDNDFLDDKFNDIDDKVDFLIELCQTLQIENGELTSKVKSLEEQLSKKQGVEEQHAEQQAVIRSKIDGLLEKLNNFSDAPINE
ncbi:MAG: cell division protein ZapB [Desulfobacteraceae bacterium]